MNGCIESTRTRGSSSNSVGEREHSYLDADGVVPQVLSAGYQELHTQRTIKNSKREQ